MVATSETRYVDLVFPDAYKNNENYHAGLMLRHFALRAWAEFVTPLPKKDVDESAWTDRLLTVMAHLEEDGVNAVLALANLKSGTASPAGRFITACEENNVYLSVSNLPFWT